MNRLFAAAALAPMLLASGAFAQTVSDEVNKQLWCGTAMVTFFTNMPPEELSPAEQEEAKSYIAGGQALIDEAVAAHLAAGFTQEAIDKIQADLGPVVMEEISNNTAKYSFEECLAILPGQEGASSSEPSADPATSSAM